MRVEKEAEKATTVVFLNASTRYRRRRRLGQSSSESSTLGLSDSKEADSSDNSLRALLMAPTRGMMKAKRKRKKRMMKRR